MGKLLVALFGLILLIVGGGIAYLATFDIPAPTQTVEIQLDDDRFPR
ncbi:hypothetical protein KAJ83_18770 [Marivibrio halodurans]|uniref:Uncharacterized protein n=1 Tax=Marivibrio halodurans TaxID=2039722 RepID=A0A8J7SQG2_9PROT|nr:hypothetical protein [Marivibrio halodurans]MBP5859071.1 hypothetical protein [Marivibrio halodurans]